MGSATTSPGSRYDMPMGFGPSFAPDVEEGFGLEGCDVQFETSREAVGALLPRWFEPAERAVITVGYRNMLGMGWMGGHDYQIVGVRVAATCDLVDGAPVNPYSMVVWESDGAPIISGRELMGAPKLFARIPAIEVGGHDQEFTCYEYDSPLLRAAATDLREVDPEEVAAASSRQESARSYYWKHIPGPLPDCTPDADYPVAIKLRTPFTRMWRGQGSLEFCTPSSEQAPYSGRIVRAFAELPRLSEVTTTAWHAADCTLFRNQTRRLDR